MTGRLFYVLSLNWCSTTSFLHAGNRKMKGNVDMLIGTVSEVNTMQTANIKNSAREFSLTLSGQSV